MAYNFIGLVNDVNSRLNEVQLTTSNFDTVTGFFAFAKEAVNSSIRHIQQEEYEWPWNFVEDEEVLTAQEPRYSYPNDAKTINLNSFRIKRSSTLNVGTTKLKNMTYEEYLEKYADAEYNTQTKGCPTHIIRTPNRELILYPMPDKAYTLVYDYYRIGYDLISAGDVPALPEQYRFVIVDGAMHYAYQFRGDTANASSAMEKFQQGIKHLRSININRTDYVRDTRVHF